MKKLGNEATGLPPQDMGKESSSTEILYLASWQSPCKQLAPTETRITMSDLVHWIKIIDERNKVLVLRKLGVPEHKGVASWEHKSLHGRNRDGFQFDRLQLLQLTLNTLGDSVDS